MRKLLPFRQEKEETGLLQSSQNKLFFLILLLLPTQFGRHFWPSFSFVLGQRVDYLTPILYLTDILIVLFVILNLIQNIKNRSRGRLDKLRTYSKPEMKIGRASCRERV